MRIVNLKEFRQLPDGTLFCKYEPCNFSNLMVKSETWEFDFLYEDIVANIKHDSSEEFAENCIKMEEGGSIPLEFHVPTRDGMFEGGQLFAIYEKEDICCLIARLEECRKSYK